MKTLISFGSELVITYAADIMLDNKNMLLCVLNNIGKGKLIPLQALCGPEGG
jgi:hypothetical protein